MIVDNTNVTEILGQLSTASENERTKIIEGVRPVLSTADGKRKYKASLENSDLTVVFDCLNASGKAEIQAASDILNQILDIVDPIVALNRYHASLIRCLHHPNPEVKVLAIRFLSKCLPSDQCLEAMFSSDSLLIDAIKLINHDEGNVAKEVKDFIYTMALMQGTEIKNEMPFVPPLLPLLQEFLHHEKEVNRLRIEELMIAIAKLSPEMTQRVASAGFLQRLCQEVLADDILVQLNAIEILSDFAESRHGLIYLENKGVLKEMDNLLSQSSSSPMANYLLPGFIKFFGRVSRNHPTNFTEMYPNFTRIVFSVFTNNGIADSELKHLAISTIGHISTTLEGKQKITSLDKKENGIISKDLVNSLRYGSTNDKNVALSACRDIISAPDDDNDGNVSSQISRDFYYGLIQSGLKDPVEYIFQIIKQPFAEISEIAFNVLQNIGKYQWGIPLFVSQPGLLEYILDRNVASKKEAKEMKYNLIKILQENAASLNGDIMPSEMLMRLKKYVKEGAFHVEAQAEVALGEV